MSAKKTLHFWSVPRDYSLTDISMSQEISEQTSWNFIQRFERNPMKLFNMMAAALNLTVDWIVQKTKRAFGTKPLNLPKDSPVAEIAGKHMMKGAVVFTAYHMTQLSVFGDGVNVLMVQLGLLCIGVEVPLKT